MMPVVSEHMKWRKHRNRFSHPISETDDPNPQIPSIIQSTRCKSTISSILLSTFSNNTTSNETTDATGQNRKNKKKNKKSHNNSSSNSNSNFSAATFRGLGCTAGSSQQVSVPAVIRSSADWQGNKNRKKKQRRNNSSKTCHGVVVDGPSHGSGTYVDFQDVWCGPGIGFSADTAASVDCVVARKNVSARRKLDLEKITHREVQRPSYLGRHTVSPESISFLYDDPDIFTPRPALDSFGTARYYRRAPHSSSDALAEIMILQGRLLMGERINSYDQYRDWRLDVDNMSYEQLLELGEKIGYVNTGLQEDEMGLNIRKIKLVISNDTAKNQIDKKCCICQEEYEADAELGRLNCEHSYHFQCIKQWLVHKNICPVCKQEVVVRH